MSIHYLPIKRDNHNTSAAICHVAGADRAASAPACAVYGKIPLNFASASFPADQSSLAMRANLRFDNAASQAGFSLHSAKFTLGCQARGKGLAGCEVAR